MALHHTSIGKGSTSGERPGWRRINLRLKQADFDEVYKIAQDFKCPMAEALRTVVTWGLTSGRNGKHD